MARDKMRIDVTAAADTVIAELHVRLLERGSALATAEALDGGLEFQAHSILQRLSRCWTATSALSLEGA
jgi:hypothetical protein